MKEQPSAARGQRQLAAWTEQLGLSPRAQRLLLEGDTENRYSGHNEEDADYRLTMALAVAASQPGQAWTPQQFYEALVLRPTAGGAWARRLRARKGEQRTMAKLTKMLTQARRYVANSDKVECRTDALVAVTQIRQAVEQHQWTGRSGGTDEKNLAARLKLCERSGGTDHAVSVRQLAELMGCAKSTAEASNARLKRAGWLRLLETGSEKNSSRWRLLLPQPQEAAQDDGATPGQSPTAGEGGAVSDPETHTTHRNTRSLQQVMTHDAFHAWGHGTSGARLVACLKPVDGASIQALARTTGLHHTTVRRRMAALITDGLAEEADGLYYLPRHLAADHGMHPDDDHLAHIAEQHGTKGMGERRRQRHARQRASYHRWLDENIERITRRCHPDQPPLRLVPEGVVDPETGELLNEAWRGWDVSDPIRPAWLGEGAPPIRNKARSSTRRWTGASSPSGTRWPTTAQLAR